MIRIDAAVEAAIGAAVGRPVAIRSRAALGGGSINRTERLDTTAGVFVLKSHPSAPPGFFRAEADGLEALRASGTTLTIPRVIACAEDEPQWLVLEYLAAPHGAGPTGPPGPIAPTGPGPTGPTGPIGPPFRLRPSFSASLGHGLALLHRASAPRFGFSRDNYCGETPQVNTWTDRWVDFYAEKRLGYQLRLAREAGLVGANDARLIERLIAHLGDWVSEPPEGPALVHGDLWSGNLHTDANGSPALLDPAAYYGHREVELGMMTLFGGFDPRVFDAYDEAFPLELGWRDRNALYQLYHLLNHLNLFGSGYHDQVMGIVRRFA